MKILFVQKEGGIFGAENYHLNIIPALMKRGVQVDFLRLYTDYQGGRGGEFIKRLNNMGVTTYEINIGRFIRPRNLFTINRLIKNGGYDLIHTHLIHADFHLALVKVLLNRKLKIVSTKHGYDNAFTARYGFDARKQGITPYYLISKWSESVMTRSFTITKALRNFFINTRLTSAEKMELIYYGFDFPSPDSDWQNTSHKIFKKQLVIAGRLVRFKGHHYVIEALSEIISAHPDAGLIIAGSGPEENDLKAMVARLNLTDYVRFIGYSKTVPIWMFNSDVVIVPSVSEGFGVVLLEAFNCRKPVVAFDVPACNELIQDGVDGLLSAPYDIRELGSRINYLLSNPNLGRKLGEEADRKQKTFFNLGRMTDETIEFYKRVAVKQ